MSDSDVADQALSGREDVSSSSSRPQEEVMSQDVDPTPTPTADPNEDALGNDETPNHENSEEPQQENHERDQEEPEDDEEGFKPFDPNASMNVSNIVNTQMNDTMGSIISSANALQGINGNDSPNVIQDVEALREEENRKKREEHLKMKIRQLKDEEQSYSKINLTNINANWLYLMRESKLKELKDTIQIQAQDHDRLVDRKNATIQLMYRELDESEEQYRSALRTHMQHIEELLQLQDQRLTILHQEFNNDLYLLKKEYEEEMEELRIKHEEEMREWAEITKEMEKREEKTNEIMEMDFAQTKEKVKNRYQEELIQMVGNMNDKIEEYRRITKQENNDHYESMNQKYKDYIILRERDSSYIEIIKNQTYQIKMKEEALAHWKAKWLNNLRECEDRNNKLIKEKDQLSQHFKDLKKKMNAFRDSEKKRLTELVKMSKDTIDSLNEKLDKASRILKLSEVNRRYETERERLIPFETELESSVALASVAESAMEDVMEGEEKNFTESEWQQLDRFYKRYNKVLLDNLALEQEKEHLVDQNKKLRDMLKQYLDGITVNEDVLNSRNPLLIVDPLIKGRSNEAGAKELVVVSATSRQAEKVKIGN
ncbi:hypothetical protein C9374_001499 [Naegleria lovaniensis]|uniref:Dynein regulatory complex subunit 2 n=1 Tax=Naegleria lovaniensis TaxID=51637 RepID=A0AA88GUA9_NAELO|nr:uncharacterized protein C9374_001499 [Naegleria lovaniensis]KAG2387167.1 hypothetical protein C9374_001499 [Naegleria lovaniensis]